MIFILLCLYFIYFYERTIVYKTLLEWLLFFFHSLSDITHVNRFLELNISYLLTWVGY